MNILGISAFYHDSAAALVIDGKIVAAAQEERFTRKKHDSDFPIEAIKYCLKESGLQIKDIDHIVFYDKPFLKFERLLETYMAFAPRGFSSFVKAIPVWIKDKLFQKSMIKKEIKEKLGHDFSEEKLMFSEHHQSHAASAFYPSPFEEAIVLTMDGVGEWATTSVAIGRGNKLEMVREIHFPHSIGLLYSAFTYYTGFKVNSGEYKVMGLAPYGEPVYKQKIMDHLIDVKEDGSFRLDMSYFNYCTGLTMTTEKFHDLFGGPPRGREDELLDQRHMNLAASVQAVVEEVVLRLARSLRKEYGIPNLCLAGGVALNCVANGKLVNEKIFDHVWVQPASGDAGGSLGAALTAHYHRFDQPREILPGDHMEGSYLGPEFSDQDIQHSLEKIGANFNRVAEDEYTEVVAAEMASGKAIGWFQGRMEFGPRALGARSIIADPRNEKMQKTLNLKVKFRESFRPFAPSVLEENVQDWFDFNEPSPYMLMVSSVKKEHCKDMTEEQKSLFGIDKLNVTRSTIPAVTHVDYSARIQTVSTRTNRKYHSLIAAFNRKTGCPIVVNTSFNVRGEPIVCTPEDAYRCFMGTDMDILAIGNFVLKKEEQPKELLERYENKFELD